MVFVVLWVVVFLLTCVAMMVWGNAFLRLPMWARLTIAFGVFGTLVALGVAADSALHLLP